MSKKNKDEEKVIMRHVLEVRFSRRSFSFMDYKGRLTDFLIKRLKADQVRLQNNGSRLELASADMQELYFFSLENFGFQSEAKSTFEDFINSTKVILDAINDFPEYRWQDGLLRIGTKSMILYHRKFDDFSTIKQAYKDILVNNHEKIAELTKSEIVDTLHVFDLKLQNSLANVLTGPVTKTEALERFFDNRQEYNSKFNKDNGLFLSIDVSGDRPNEITDIESLKRQIGVQVADIETLYIAFKKHFDN